MTEDMRPLLTRRAKIILAILMVIAVLTGYLGYLYRSAKSIRVEDVSLEELRISGLRVNMRIGLDLYNPAIQQLSADAIHYDVYIEDIYVGSGEIRSVRLKPRAVTHVSLPINVSLVSLGAGLMPILIKALSHNKVHVTVKSSVLLDIGISGLHIGSLTLHYTVTRDVSLAS